MIFKKQLKHELVSIKDFDDFKPKEPKFNISYCKDYFEDILDKVNSFKEVFNNVHLFIIRSSSDCKSTDLYINNKIKLLKMLGISVSIIYFDPKTIILNKELSKLMYTIKKYIFYNKSKSFYYLLQKDSSINNNRFLEIYKYINNSIKYNKLKLIDVEILNPFYIDSDVYSLQLNSFKNSLVNNNNFSLYNTMIGACTPIGAVNMLKYYNKLKKGDNCIVYGKSEILGRPLSDILSQIGCTVLTFNSPSKYYIYDEILKNVDSIFLCMNSCDYFDLNLYNKINKDKCNIIDFGINYDKGYLSGNISEEVLKEHSDCKRESIITTTPSGTALTTLIQIVINILFVELYN